MEPDELKPQKEANCELGNRLLKESDLEKDSYVDRARQEEIHCELENTFDVNPEQSEHNVHKEQSINLKKTGTSVNESKEKLETLETSSVTKVERSSRQPRDSECCFRKADMREGAVDTSNSVQAVLDTSKSNLVRRGPNIFQEYNSDEHCLSQHVLCDSPDDQQVQQSGSPNYIYNIDGYTCSQTEEKENCNSYSGISSASVQEKTELEKIPVLPSPPSSLPSLSSSSNCSDSDDMDSLNESGSNPKQPNETAARQTFKQGQTVSAPEDLTWRKTERKKLRATASFPVSGSSARSHSNSSSYTYSLGSATTLPSELQLFDNNSRIVWPLKENLSVDKEEYCEGKQWHLLTELGRGAYGSCHLATEPSSEKIFCVKKCRYKRDEVLPMYLAAKENIPEIVHFLGATVIGRDVCIFMESLGSSIEDIVRKPNGLASVRPLAMDYIQDVLKALSFIHRKGIVHNDVKGANVLFVDDYQLRVKLIDFGNAASSEVSPRSRDIWHTGCLFIEMLTGKRSPLFAMFQNASNIYLQEYLPDVNIEIPVLELCFDTSSTADIVLKRMEELKNTGI